MVPRISTRRSLSSRSSISSASSDSSPTRSIQSFLESPPPSPGLPSILPRHGKKQPPRRLRNAMRFFVRKLPWLLGMAASVWLLFAIIQTAKVRFNIKYFTNSKEPYRIVGADQLPEDPTPVVLVDLRRGSRWTVYIPEKHEFPLRPDVIADLCSESQDIISHLQKEHKGPRFPAYRPSSGYYHVDKTFVDVQEAQDRGLLPQSARKPGKAINSLSTFNGEALNETSTTSAIICDRSLTYVLESTDAGLGNALLGLWTSYGLAQKEHRAFFVDDRRWAYGKYATFFLPPPTPSCLPPRESHRLPCPHSARHLLVSSATFSHTFGPAFTAHFRTSQIFDLARTGYEALFHLADPDAAYLAKRRGDLDAIRAQGGAAVGVHVRHGDQRPWEYMYRQSYIPLGKYADAAKALVKELASAKNGSSDASGERASSIVLASDDPDVYTSPDLGSVQHAQDQIVMASKAQLDAAQKTIRIGRKNFKDENMGWEGGFFKAVFWNLGRVGVYTGRGGQEEKPSELAVQLRGLIGRAYLLDMAVLGEADAVVCGIGSASCRVLAVMMGWERVKGGKGWRNVDGGWGWKGWVGEEGGR